MIFKILFYYLYSNLFVFKLSSKIDDVIFTGLVDDAALPRITKKNKIHINNFKNIQKVLFMPVVLVVNISKNVCEKQVLKGVYKKSNRDV